VRIYGACSFHFFFSSRRRHTRFDCDWSSDVCSSDLTREAPEPLGPIGDVAAIAVQVEHNEAKRIVGRRVPGKERQPVLGCDMFRSEERRVGKECRASEGTEELQQTKEETDSIVRSIN